MEYETGKPISIYKGRPNYAKIFDEILNELKKRRILKRKQPIVCDKGCYTAKNYLIGINKYKIIPLTFPKKKPNLKKLKSKIYTPFSLFQNP
jgi:hypothetical protein